MISKSELNIYTLDYDYLEFITFTLRNNIIENMLINCPDLEVAISNM